MSRKLTCFCVFVLFMCAGTTHADLVAHWSLDDGSGDVAADVTGNGHDGALIDGPEWAEGLYGGALRFGGSPAKVDVPYSADLNPEEFTTIVWANPDPSGSGHRSPLTSRDDFPARGYILYAEPGNTWEFWIGDGSAWAAARGSAVALGEWTHVAGTYEEGNLKLYLNGELDTEGSGTISANTARPLRIGAGQTDGPGNYFWVGLIDDAAVFNHALTQAEIQSAMSGISPRELAAKPDPEEGAEDVLRDTVLSWTPGIYAGTHNVYVGESVEDVGSATVPTAGGLDDSAYDPGRLEFGKSYFWRVDEVNASPDKTVHEGAVWNFTVEPYSIRVAADAIAVTASSTNINSDPNLIIDGSGLDQDGKHSNAPADMWQSAPADPSPWLMFEMDKVQKLDTMVLWNSNHSSESVIGWGIKDVEIETSLDGVEWTVVPGISQLMRGPGSVPSEAQVVDMGLTLARYVRLNIVNNWGGLLPQYGVAEVQFYSLPTQARTPVPASGSADVLPDAVVTWRAGREAGQHTIYLSMDSNAVADGSAQSVSSNINSLDLGSLDLELGQTYYWRVDEVNDAETPAITTGEVWSMSTSDSLVVDDFESYNNLSPDRPFQAWLDGIGYSVDEFFPVAYGGNDTGAAIGHDIWTVSSPYFDGDIMDTARAMGGSDQSMPFYYSNTGAVVSQTDRTFAQSQDWTVGGAKTLSIGVLGQADNTGTLYVKINNTKKMYEGDLTAPIWTSWEIDLASLGIPLNSVTTVSLGVDGAVASGLVLIDEIRLYRAVPEPAETVSLVNDFDALAVGSSMHDVPGWEGWYGDARWGAKIVDTIAYSGSNALEIVGTRDDVVPNWPLVDSGMYVATVMQYVPASSTNGLMYFGPLSAYGNDSATWLGTLLSNCNLGLVYVDDLDSGSRTETPLIRDQWVELRIVMNFDNNTCDFYYGNVALGTLPCPSAQGFDIWPDDDVDVLYYDDFRFESPQ